MCDVIQKGPQSGPQPNVKYCPNCKGDIRPIRSHNKKRDEAHSYQCDVCDKVFEINHLARSCARRDESWANQDQ